MMESQPDDIEEGRTGHERIDKLQQAYTLIRLIRNSIQPHYRPSSNNPNIPRTPLNRLALASPDSPGTTSDSTVLYLAYGANLSQAALDRHDVKPISQINVSAPAFDLAFDLPGLPYWEPCFSNLTPRKIPKPPIPGEPPIPPFDPPKPPFDPPSLRSAKCPESLFPSLPPGVPSWNKGLYGVVYELTRDDYRKIVRAEGGGSAYQDILTPVLALPPPLGIPEKPPIPELPKPFIAHTLYAPRLPSLKPPGDGDGSDSLNNNDDDDDPRDKKWWQKLLLPVHRPDGYAQPSARYLQLIRDGAHEHYLPDDYQLYLAKLQSYKITTCRQEVGRWLFLLIFLPLFVLIKLLGYFLADKKNGKVPIWLGATSAVLANLLWKMYDMIFKPLFGDGERTIEDDSESRRIRNLDLRRDTSRWGSEKNALLGDW
ncbi:uncharacterized protein F4807DRAFT_79294 [Annulohypoxylon truncatum]|uniref:uncharacterized protein n=1 Tax=Annulohypoxylon truncatum TaxID=327061 RepID=UPI0020082FAE|nr:uncharacterized protein F4807DRAFT_79294 [Annulohypoxylon truncatum]KAI1209943.1 hypothetical protein F4807DRAFT_79294 [Annulohypoxylon truncatum]